jgi:hypothetical protein
MLTVGPAGSTSEERSVKRSFLAIGAVALAMSVAGCNTPQGYNAGNGAVLGGATGALVGGLATGRAGGALAGGALGAATGALIGAASTPPPGYYPPPPRTVYVEPAPRPACARRGFDEFGNPVCLAYYGY